MTANFESALLIETLTNVERDYFRAVIDSIREKATVSKIDHLNRYLNHLENVCLYFNEGTILKDHMNSKYRYFFTRSLIPNLELIQLITDRNKRDSIIWNEILITIEYFKSQTDE